MNKEPISASQVSLHKHVYKDESFLSLGFRGFGTVYPLTKNGNSEVQVLINQFVNDYNNSDFDPDK